MKKLFHSACILITMMVLVSCAKNSEQKVNDAIQTALNYLSQDGKCDDAIDVLEEVGRQYDNALYMMTLSSGYACKADFSVLKLLEDVDVLVAGGQTFLRSLTTLQMSQETAADSASFTNLQTAIDLLLYTGKSTSQTTAQRLSLYGTQKGTDLNLQALYMILTNLGKYFHYYGNVDAGGVKGGGAGVSSQDNDCLVQYTEPNIQAYIVASGSTGACDSLADYGHYDLDLSPSNLATTKIRMCRGLVLFNNLLDILNNTTLPASSDLGDIQNVVTDYNSMMTSLIGIYPQLQTLADELDLQSCVDYVNTSSTEFDELQLLYGMIFETALI